ncbi:MAG: hypothetical protein AB1529_04415 [Candidatus Micrarchaeota archaeon]
MLKTLLNVLLIIAALLLFVAVWSAWGPVPLLINTIIALVALKVVGWLGVKTEVNVWSLLIVLIGGVAGLLILIFLSVTGLAFKGK